MTPTVRLSVRALLAGAAVFASSLQQQGGQLDSAALRAALAAAVLAAVEFLTPVNATVGVGRKQRRPRPRVHRAAKG